MKKKNIKFERHKVRKPVSETHKKSMDNRNICKSNGITDDEQEESKNFGIQNENSRLDASIISDKNILSANGKFIKKRKERIFCKSKKNIKASFKIRKHRRKMRKHINRLNEKECQNKQLLKDMDNDVATDKCDIELRDEKVPYEIVSKEKANHLNADWSGYERTTFSERVLKVFAKEYLKTKEADSVDRNFCYMALNTREALDIEIIEDYISYKLGKKVKSSDRGLIFNNLLEIMNMSENLKVERRVFNRPRKIIVD